MMFKCVHQYKGFGPVAGGRPPADVVIRRRVDGAFDIAGGTKPTVWPVNDVGFIGPVDVRDFETLNYIRAVAEIASRVRGLDWL